MRNFERVIMQQKVTYLKSKFWVKFADLYLTDDELIMEADNSTFRPRMLNTTPLKIRFSSRPSEFSIPFTKILSIRNISSSNKSSLIEFTDVNGRDYKFEMRNNQELLDIIQSKILKNNN